MTVSSALSYYSVVFNYLGKKFGPLLVEAPTLTQWKNDKDTCLQHCQISTYLGYSMKNTYCLFQIKFITEYTNVQHVIITQILLK